MKRIGLLIAVALLWAITGVAQQTDAPVEDEDDGFLVRIINDALSGPGRDVRISGISGLLFRNARIEEIAVSDADGTWLVIRDVEIDWNRAALFRRRLTINALSIAEIDYRRPALPGEPEPAGLAAAEARPFQLPELPVEVRIGALAVDRLALGAPVLGQAAEFAATGRADLVGGEIETELALSRTDGPGGELALALDFSNATREIDLDLRLREPAGGVLATALDIENRPAIDLALAGAGPLEEVDIDFSLDADAARLAAGRISLRESAEGQGFLADFAGALAPLVPAAYRDFFAGETRVRVDGVARTGGGLRLDEILVAGAALNLGGNLETGPDNFLRGLNLTGTIGDPRAAPVTLPVPGAATRLNSGTIHVEYGAGSRWSGIVWLDRLALGEIEVEDLSLTLGGLARNLEDPATRNVTIHAEGLATGIWAEDPELRAAIGSRIDFFTDLALPPAGPIDLRQLQISGNGLSLFTAGTLQDLVYTGRIAARVADISPLSALADRPLGGGIDLRAEGSVALASAGFDLVLDGSASDLAIGEPRADALLAGTTRIEGGLRRDETGLSTEALRIENDQIAFTSTGQVSSGETDIGFEARLADLALVSPELAGALTATGRATGSQEALALAFEAAVPQGTVAGRGLTGARLGFDGTLTGSDIAGALSGAGSLDGAVIALSGDVSSVAETRRVEDLVLSVGPNRITGSVAQSGEGPAIGELALRAPQIEPLAALALLEARGSANADITLFASEIDGAIGQGVGIGAAVRDLLVEGTAVGALDLEAEVRDALGVPLADATLAASDLVVAGTAIETLDARARTTGPASMDFTAATRLAIGTEIGLDGGLERLDGGFGLDLERLELTQQAIAARLLAPTRVTILGETVTIEPLALALGAGRLDLSGTIAEDLDLDLTIADLPLALANAVQPGLGLEGSVNGTARVGGRRDAPDVAFALTGAGLASAATREAGLPAFGLDARGSTDGTRLALQAALSGAGIAADLAGSVPLDDGLLDLRIDLGALPLALIDRAAGNQGLQGTITGAATVGGTLAAPTAEFTLSGTGLSARVLRENAVPPLALAATGRFAETTLTLGPSTVTGPGGIALSASGTVPLQGPGLALGISGSVPLALANAALAERTAALTGALDLDLSVSGSLADPSITGPLTIQGATFTDPGFNARFEGITLAAFFEGDALRIDSLGARGAQGGTLSASGRVSIDGAAGFPSDVQIGFDDLRLTDGSFYSTRLTGALALAGPVTGGGGRLTGRIDLGPTEISVAEGIAGSSAAILDQIAHRNVPAPVARTLERARVSEPAPPQATGAGGIELDILVSAPNQIFVRGRGLDVELGGSLRLQGPTSDIQPVGEFTLRRGRIAILGQRIQFDEGSLRLIGNFDPEIRFVAETAAADATAFVTVEGRVSAPEITFSSIPERPEDEVLALVLFNRATDQLSPFQIAQLAAAAAELAGAGGNGLLARFRGATGLDDLDVLTEEDGTTAVRAGRYLADNLYLDVTTTSEGDARASVNIDLTDRVTARGSVDTDGNSTIGIFYQRDY